MDAILTRIGLTHSGDAPVIGAPTPASGGVKPALGRLLLGMAHGTAERLVSPQRDLAPEWFRFPLP
jgi:hypothetical protein